MAALEHGPDYGVPDRVDAMARARGLALIMAFDTDPDSPEFDMKTAEYIFEIGSEDGEIAYTPAATLPGLRSSGPDEDFGVKWSRWPP
jgi:hypothetical protein